MKRLVTGLCLTLACASPTFAQNSLSVLQFGSINGSTSLQSGSGNSASVLQFGVGVSPLSVASVTQWGSPANPTSSNVAVIGQGGSATNVAGVNQLGYSNTAFVGQIGLTTNSASVFQLGVSNSAQAIQSVP